MTPRALLACLCLVAIGLGFVPKAAGAAEPLATVPRVDLDRYLGRWYEIARYPNFFQRNCKGEVTATYSRREDGTIAVDNACLREDGGTDQAIGAARIVDAATNAKLEVRFAPAFLSFLPFVWGDYWVIDLAPDYSYAVVGEPSRKYLWILAREPRLDAATFEAIVARLRSAGYDPARLIRTGSTR
jgi:apolipoprotein D and lipocalin family protein